MEPTWSGLKRFVSLSGTGVNDSLNGIDAFISLQQGYVMKLELYIGKKDR
jgi:hypothetical protein